MNKKTELTKEDGCIFCKNEAELLGLNTPSDWNCECSSYVTLSLRGSKLRAVDNIGCEEIASTTINFCPVCGDDLQ